MSETPSQDGCCEQCCCNGHGCCAESTGDDAPAGLTRRQALERLAGIGLGVAAASFIAGCPAGPPAQTTADAGDGAPPAPGAPVTRTGLPDVPQGQAVNQILDRNDDARSLTPEGLVRLADTADLPYLSPVEFRVDKKLLYLYHGHNLDRSDFFAVYDRRCPHNGCTLKAVTVKVPDDEDRCEFRCPCHGSRFDDRGHRLAGPARRDMTQYFFKLEDKPVIPLVARDATQIVCVDFNHPWTWEERDKAGV
jgi:Rieske Fe-S protein